MYHMITSCIVCCVAASVMFGFVSPASALYSGSRGGASGRDATPGRETGIPSMLSAEVAQSYITVTGRAEQRVQPTEIRIVLAVTAEEKTPTECSAKVTAKIAALRGQWRDAGVPNEKIIEDFIAVLPRYQFDIENRHGRDLAIEKRAGYLMQTNLHIAVHNDAEAKQVIKVAFDNDVADIIGFDYWSDQMEELKKRVRTQAVQAAREKAAALLTNLFAIMPPLINLQEQTVTVYPEALYESFKNSSDDEYRSSYARSDIPEIRIFRPKNTYYRGFYPDADIQSDKLPMQSEISVVSTVRLYFQSPAVVEASKADRVRDSSKAGQTMQIDSPSKE
jgi:uncharacterized protein YggE